MISSGILENQEDKASLTYILQISPKNFPVPFIGKWTHVKNADLYSLFLKFSRKTWVNVLHERAHHVSGLLTVFYHVLDVSLFDGCSHVSQPFIFCGKDQHVLKLLSQLFDYVRSILVLF